jgi:hypothetical protein
LRRHAKASSAGSNLDTGTARARLGIAFACVFALLAFAGSSASSAFAAVPAKGVVGFFGAKAGGAAGQIESPQGVAVNQASGNVYAVDTSSNRVDVFDSNGKFLRSFGQDVVAYGPDQSTEVQYLDVAATAGNFKLSFEGRSTPELPAAATAAAVQTALNGLETISKEGGSLTVTGGPGDATGSSPYRIAFNGGPLAKANVAQIGTVNVSLSGGSPATAITIGTANNGESGFEICVPASGDACKNGSEGSAGGSMSSPQGIAVNQASGDVYVTDQGNRRVDQYDQNGNFIRAFGKDVVATGFPGNSAEASAAQTLTVTATGGKYKLKFAGQETAELAFNATAAQIQTALQGLSSIGAGNATVTETSAGVFKVTFAGNLANNPEPLITTESGPGEPLSGGTATVANTTTGSNAFEVCLPNTICKAAAAAAQGTTNGAFAGSIGYPAVAPAGAPNAGNLLVADSANLRVQEFSSAGIFLRAFGFDVTKGGPGNTGTAFEVCTEANGDACKVGVTGSGNGQFATATPTRVAEDSAGDVYTVEPTANFRVQKFTLPSNVVTPQGPFDAADLTGVSGAAPTDVAVNPANNDVLVNKGFAAGVTPSCPILGTPSVAESRAIEVSSAGALEGTHGACVGMTPVSGLAVRGSNGNVYVSSTFVAPRVYVLNAGQPAAPTVSITNVSGVGAHAATINALINPAGPELPYGNETTYKLEYKRSVDASFSTLYNTEATAGNRTTASAIALTAGGLEAGTSYDVRLVATKGLGSGGASQTVSFSTASTPPDVSLMSYLPVNGTSAVLEGSVNPDNSATGYHFDYVGQAGFEASGFTGATRVPAADASAGSGATAVRAAQQISGLAPGTTYHYRLVASNTPGQSTAAGTFTTPVNPAECPNARLRSEQTSSTLPAGSSFLPQCMGLEMVSPPQKFNQYAIEGQIGVTDDRIQITALPALDSPRLGSVLDKYLSSRSASGWTTHAMQMGANYSNGSVATGLPCATAPDLSNWTTFASTESQAKLGISNVLQQNSSGIVYQLGPVLSPTNTVGVFAVGNSPCSGGSADGSHFYFAVTGGVYGAGDPVPSPGEALYDVYNNGAGEPRAELIQRDRHGVVVGGACGAGIGGSVSAEPLPKRGTTSPDGSWLYFTTNPQQPARASCNASVYRSRVVRRDLTPLGPEISEVGSNECTRTAPACDTTDGDDNYVGASQEGNKVFFTSTRQLTNTDLDSGTSCSREPEATSRGCDLYLYDSSRPVGARLTQVSAGDSTDPTPGKGAEVLGVADIAGDGSHVYFVARGVLTTNPNQYGKTAKVGERNLYVYERDSSYPAGRTAFIGDLAAADSTVWKATNHTAIAVPMLGSNLENHAVGGDGHILALLSNAPLTPDDTDGGFTDFYRYDSNTGSLERVSKAAPGGSDNGPFNVSFRGPGGKAAPSQTIGEYGAEPGLVFQSRRISEDGQTLAFVTGEQLSPSDTDGGENAYVWHDGNLIPIPTAGTPSVSASGDEVVFTTGSELLAEDGDGAADVYAARINGGFPIPVAAVPCAGEACQGAPKAQPGGGAAATEAASGSGNLPAKKKHQKKKHHKHKKHKTRHGQKRAGREHGGQK